MKSTSGTNKGCGNIRFPEGEEDCGLQEGRDVSANVGKNKTSMRISALDDPMDQLGLQIDYAIHPRAPWHNPPLK